MSFVDSLRSVAAVFAKANPNHEPAGSPKGGQFARKTLVGVVSGWDAAGIKNAVSEKGNVVTLSQIVVPEGQRGRGVGGDAMRALTDYADETGKRIALSPSTDFGASSKARLVSFYEGHGFVANKGRNKDFAISESMIREPCARIAKSNPNHHPAGSPGGKGGQFAPKAGIATPEAEAAFKKWFGDSKIVDEDGKPLVLYHGTTGDFASFSQARANSESDWGAGFYFSNSPVDIEHNYAGEGPDLTNKIILRAEQIEQEDDFEGDSEEAKRRARDELDVEHGGATVPVYLALENPFVVGDDGESFLDYGQDYDEETEEYGEERGKLVDFIVALRQNAEGYSDGKVDGVISAIMDEASGNEGISASRLDEILRNDEDFAYYTNDEGKLVNKEIVRQSLEDAGFDGVIDRTVNKKFGTERERGQAMKGVTYSTVHYIVFQANRIKSALGNAGTFSPTSESIIKAKWDKRYPKGTEDGGKFAPGNGTGSKYLDEMDAAEDEQWDSHYDWLHGKGPAKPYVKPATWAPHPKRDDKGGEVGINYPSKASDADTWTNADATATFVPGGATPPSLNDVEFKSWNAPTTPEEWAKVSGQNDSLLDGPLVPKHEKDHASTGVLIVESDGRVWLTEPTNHFGGYKATWPKGTLEPGLSPQANAIKEAWEETGLKVRIIGSLGDHQRDTSVARMYVAIRESGTPRDMGWESQSMKLAPIGDAQTLLNRTHDRDIAKMLHEVMRSAKIVKAKGPKPSLRKLYLPASNINAPGVNKKLDLIGKYGHAGDINGLLSLNFGSNNYAKAAVKATNEWLDYHGSTHKVTTGQKANSHPALAGGPVPNAVTSMSSGESVARPPKSSGTPQVPAMAGMTPMGMKAPEKADDTKQGDGDFESKHPRYPKGHPLGGQFMKKDEAGLTLPPDVPGYTGANAALYAIGQKAAAGDAAKLDFLKNTAGGQANAGVKAYAQQLLDDIDEANKVGAKAFTPPPNDYHWFGVAHKAAVAGDTATLDALGDKYKSKSLQATLNGYVDKLKGEMASGGLAVDPSKPIKIETASVLGVDVPSIPPGAITQTNALGVMSKAAITGDKDALGAAVGHATYMAENNTLDPEQKWQKVVDYGTALQGKMDDSTIASATADRIMGPTNISTWTKVGDKPGGTNPGALFKDKDGTKWLVKGNLQQANGKVSNVVSDDRAKNEVLASKLMEAAGIPAPEMKLVRLAGQFGATNVGDGQLGVAVKWIDGVKPFDPASNQVLEARTQFGVHAWLANYDVVGMGFDNMVNTKQGLMNIDPGGALLFRAQGLKKDFLSHAAGEWDSMRDGKINSYAATVFGGMTSEQLIEAANKVGAIKPEVIDELVKTYGPGNDLAKKSLATKIQERRLDIMDRASKLAGGNATEFVGADGTHTIKLDAPKNAEFEAKHERNADGTFKKKDALGLTPPSETVGYMGAKKALYGMAQKAHAGNSESLGHLKDTIDNPQIVPEVKAYASQLVADLEGKKVAIPKPSAAALGIAPSTASGLYSAAVNGEWDTVKLYQKNIDESMSDGKQWGPVKAYANTLAELEPKAADSGIPQYGAEVTAKAGDHIYEMGTKGDVAGLKNYLTLGAMPPAQAYAHQVLAAVQGPSPKDSFGLSTPPAGVFMAKPMYGYAQHLNAGVLPQDKLDTMKDALESATMGGFNDPATGAGVDTTIYAGQLVADLKAKGKLGGDGNSAAPLAIPKPPTFPSGMQSTKESAEKMYTNALGGNFVLAGDWAANHPDSTLGKYAKSLLATQNKGGGPLPPHLESVAEKLEAVWEDKKPAGPLPGMPDFDSYKLALVNSNAASVNKKVDQLKAFALAGDEKGILSLGYGSNNYAMKHHIGPANQALAAMGSKYQVTPSQKAGEHPAVNLTGAAKVKADIKSAAPGTKTYLTVPESALTPIPEYKSSNKFKHDANNAALQYIHGLAKAGDFEALKSATYKEINLDTGVETGALKPFATYPSSPVSSYYATLLNDLNEIANPPKPLVLGIASKAKTLSALAKEMTVVPLLTDFDKVPSDSKFGWWYINGYAPHVEVPEFSHQPLSSSQISAGKKAYSAYSSITKEWIANVQSSGSFATAYRYPKQNPGYGGPAKLKAMADAARKESTPLPVGATLYRSDDLTDFMVKNMPALKKGTVLQLNGHSSASFVENAVGANRNTLLRIKALPGARIVHSHGSGGFSGEKETTLLGDSRYIFLSHEKQGKRNVLNLLLLPPQDD